MRKFIKIFITTFVTFVFFGCASTKITFNPSEIEYTEISAETYFSSSETDLYPSAGKGYKVSDVYILSANTKVENGKKEGYLILGSRKDGTNRISVNATDFCINMNNVDPSWTERVDSVKNNEKYNGHYTVYLYCAGREGNWWYGYTTKIVVYNIEGVPSQEQLDADKAEEERKIRAEKEAEERKIRAEKEAEERKRVALDAKGKAIAKGYVYHGIDEDAKSRKLFANGALEEGHAYYISGFVVQYNGSMAAIEYGDGLIFSSRSSSVYVGYINQKVKAEIVEAGIKSFWGTSIETPLKVVVAGGKGIVKTPVVLGLIKEE